MISIITQLWIVFLQIVAAQLLAEYVRVHAHSRAFHFW